MNEKCVPDAPLRCIIRLLDIQLRGSRTCRHSACGRQCRPPCCCYIVPTRVSNASHRAIDRSAEYPSQNNTYANEIFVVIMQLMASLVISALHPTAQSSGHRDNEGADQTREARRTSRRSCGSTWHWAQIDGTPPRSHLQQPVSPLQSRSTWHP
mgnify:FL=1